jgi:RNA polymerase sigma factor (sigma-70 family)
MPYSSPPSEPHLNKPEYDNSLDPTWQNLKRKLSSGNPDAWNEVFDLLYPVAFQSARVILSGKFESDCEDVTMETMKEILDQAMHADSPEALVPLTAAIARNKSKDLLRRRLAGKRGGNNLESLDLLIESSGESAVAIPQADFLDALTIGEVGELLAELSKELKKEYRLVLKDHFFDHLSHSEIADKRKIAEGSVGKYLQRGISCLREIVARKPKLHNELREALTEISTVQVLLPLISTVQLRPYAAHQLGLYEPVIMASRAMASLIEISSEERERRMKQRTDEEILRSAPDELPELRKISPHFRTHLLGELAEKFPNEVEAWRLRKNQEAGLEATPRRKNRRTEMVAIAAIWLGLAVLVAGLAFGLIHLIQYFFSS